MYETTHRWSGALPSMFLVAVLVGCGSPAQGASPIRHPTRGTGRVVVPTVVTHPSPTVARDPTPDASLTVLATPSPTSVSSADVPTATRAPTATVISTPLSLRPAGPG